MSEQQQNAYPQAWRDHDATYDPNGALMDQRGRDYLDVQNRIRWFVRDQRALIVAGVATTTYEIRAIIIEHDAAQGFALFSGYVRDVLGNECTMFGSETRKDFGDYIEKANTKAIGRALIALGYSTGAAQALGEDPDRPADAPRDRRQQQQQRQQQSQQATRQPTPIRQQPQPVAPQQAPQRPRETPEPAAPTPAPTPVATGPWNYLADVSFRNRCRLIGYKTVDQVQQLVDAAMGQQGTSIETVDQARVWRRLETEEANANAAASAQQGGQR